MTEKTLTELAQELNYQPTRYEAYLKSYLTQQIAYIAALERQLTIEQCVNARREAGLIPVPEDL